MEEESALVAAWDEAAGQPAWRRSLVLAAALTTVDGEQPSPEALAARPLGELAARLVALGLRLDDRVEAVATCRACGEKLEVEVPRAQLPGPTALPDPAPFTVSGDDWRVTARLPTPADLVAVGDADDAESALLGRCLLAAEPASLLDVVPDAVAEAVGREMEARDPGSVLRSRLVCAECGAEDEYVVDLAAWCWEVLDGHVQRLLDGVRRLAAAYGWTEPDVLALGPNRRAFYLELVP
jgi:hypothetical protein